MVLIRELPLEHLFLENNWSATVGGYFSQWRRAVSDDYAAFERNSAIYK